MRKSACRYVGPVYVSIDLPFTAKDLPNGEVKCSSAGSCFYRPILPLTFRMSAHVNA